MAPLMYKGYSIVFQEVPDEVSLAINISGCQHHCPDCHSKYLWDNDGAKVLAKDIEDILAKYQGLVSCVCFMGGDHNFQELMNLCNMAKASGLKTCLYTGYTLEEIEAQGWLNPLKESLDYLKTGPFIQAKGGLSSPTTNQKFFKIEEGCLVNITNAFNKGK